MKIKHYYLYFDIKQILIKNLKFLFWFLPVVLLGIP